MNTKENTQEQISALADDELPDGHIELVMAALRHQESRDDWDIYHQIGDVLRSDDMAFALSADFSARLASRLDEEPAIVAPIHATVVAKKARAGLMKRFAIPGMAVAAVAGVVFVIAPMIGGPGQSGTSMQASTSTAGKVVTVAAGQETVMLRDSRIDEYLMAHQRFSPSVFSAAQYARSATFASDSSK